MTSKRAVVWVVERKAGKVWRPINNNQPDLSKKGGAVQLKAIIAGQYPNEFYRVSRYVREEK